MLIYKKSNTLVGTFNLPSEDDSRIVYKNDQGQVLQLIPNDTYLDNGQGGIISQTTGQTINLFLEGTKIIPSSLYLPQKPKLVQHSKYLYELVVTDVDYAYADEYFNANLEGAFDYSGNCTSVWRDGKLYRNFDWYYSNSAAFVTRIASKLADDFFVHGQRFASIGVADSVPGLTTSFVQQPYYSGNYKLIPFYVVDGVNSQKVSISMNVVPKDHGNFLETTPETEERYRIQASALPRFVLDNFSSASEAVEYLKNYVVLYPNKALASSHYDVHYIISDLTNSYIVEVLPDSEENYRITSLLVSGSNSAIKPIITNFHVLQDSVATPITLDTGKVYTPSTVGLGKLPSSQGITNNGSGLERYNIIVDNYESLDQLDFRQLVLYNKAYTLQADEQSWYTEFVGTYPNAPEGLQTLTVDSLPAQFESYVMPIVRQMYKARSRADAKTWHTAHNSVYDLDTLTLTVKDASEDNKPHQFTL